ncbi:mate-domain-containing protein, partial [Conidiobolus coronatus NRRL 28638]
FLKVLLLGAFPYIAFDCLIKFLLAQGITKAQSYITFLVLPIHIALNYLLIVNPSTSVGFIGAPLATVLTYWLMFILGLIYVLFIDGYQAWGGWSKKCLKEWMPFIKMSIASVVMTCSEWWAFEILALGASYLGVLELASYSVVMSIGSLTWHVCFAVSLIASIRSGNLIGEGIVNKAIFTIRSSFITSFLCSCGNVTTVLLLHRQLASIFSSDPEVIDMASALLPVAASYQVFDGLSTVASGVLRGQGKHHTGAVINAIGYYMISIPLGFYLAFNCNMGLRGLYAGILVTLVITSACLIYSVLNSDW